MPQITQLKENPSNEPQVKSTDDDDGKWLSVKHGIADSVVISVYSK